MTPNTMYGLLSVRHQEFPKTFAAAMKLPDAHLWKAAADSEMKAHELNKTWMYSKLPAGKKALKSRWVFTIKQKPDGTIERYKARLVVKGFLQVYGIDYNETYAPVIRMEVLRLLLTIGAAADMEIHQMDVQTAFLNSEVHEEIYMDHPEGFILSGKENLVCRLLKSLYGLKQAPREWYLKLSDFLQSQGYTPLFKDQCVFIKTESTGYKSIISVYVDDLLLFARDLGTIKRLKAMMSSAFKMTDLGEVKHILGWNITRDRAARTIFIDQEKYVSKVLDKFGFSDCRDTSRLPMGTGERLTKDMSPTTPEEVAYMQNIPYREAVGSFMYLMMGSRPDLTNFLREISSHLCKPGIKHWEAVKRGFRYLKRTHKFGLLLGGFNLQECLNKQEELMSVYVDSDFNNCPDRRRSVSGYAIFFGLKSLISWLSRMQRSVTLSTTEAEYMALAHSVMQLMFLRNLLSEMDISQQQPVRIMEDNTGCIKLANKGELNARSRHVDNKYQFVQEQSRRGSVLVQYISTCDQVADIFTKNLDFPTFVKHRTSLGVILKPENML